MAGRVLRSSRGRFNGSTKGWGAGRKVTKNSSPEAQAARKAARKKVAKRVALGAGLYVGARVVTNMAVGAHLSRKAVRASNASWDDVPW